MTLQLLSVYVGHHIGLAMAQVGKNLFFFFFLVYHSCKSITRPQVRPKSKTWNFFRDQTMEWISILGHVQSEVVQKD